MLPLQGWTEEGREAGHDVYKFSGPVAPGETCRRGAPPAVRAGVMMGGPFDNQTRKEQEWRNLLEKVAGMLGGLWDWTVHLNGGLQIVLVLLAVVMSGVCAIVAKRMQSPMMDMGGSVAGRTAVSIAAYMFGVVFLIVALFGVAAVFAPLLGFVKL